MMRFRTVTLAGFALLSAVSTASAQEPVPQQLAYSSSVSGSNPFAGEDIDGRDLGSAPNRTIRELASPQFGGGGGTGRYHHNDANVGWSHLAFEAGGGFTAPIGNAVNGGFTSVLGTGQNFGTITYGGNLLIGGGYNFSKRLGILGEFQYNANKIPGRTLSVLYTQLDPSVGLSANGITNIGGSVHTYSVTAEPIFYYYNSSKGKYGGYLIGGGGFYHKSTNLTAPVTQVDPFFGFEVTTNQTFSSVSDNAVGGNLGTGIYIKPFGEFSTVKFFAEARYHFVNTPAETATTPSNTFHTGTEELIPVTFGIRF